MGFNINTKKYIEESSNINEFTCVYSHLPQSLEVEEVRGKMYSMVQIKGPIGLNSIEATDRFLDSLESTFFGEDPTPIPQVLDKSLKVALYAINEYFESTGFVDNIIFDFCAAVIKDDVLYIAKVEDGFIYLIRDGKVLDLGRSLLDIVNPKVIEIGSGIINDKDKIVLSNTVADSLVTDWQLLSTYSEAEITRLITPGEEAPDKMAFLIVEVAKKEDIVSESTLVEPVDQTELKDEDPLNTIPREVPGIEAEAPTSMAKPTKKAYGAIIDMADNVGERILMGLKYVLKEINGYIKYVYAHRKEIYTYITSKLGLMYKKGYALYSKYILKKPQPTISNKNFYGSEIPKTNSKGVGNLISSITKTNSLPERGKSRSGSKTPPKFVVPVVIVGLMFFFIVFLFIKSHIEYSNRLSEFNNLDAKISTNISQAQSAQDFTQIDQLYSATNSYIKTAKALNIDNSKVNSQSLQIQSIDDTAHNITRVTPTVLSDLSLSYSEAKPSSIAIGANNLYVISATTGEIFSFNESSPSSGSKLSSSILTSPVSATSMDDGSVMVYDSNNGVASITADGSISQVTGLSDIKNVISIGSFEGNLYFLDPGDQVIYKSVPVGNGYSLASNYITDSNISDAESIAIDGNVFVASPTQNILRYFGGKPTSFTETGTEKIGKPFGPITAVFDTKYLSNMYILDSQNDRVVVLSKPTGDAQTYTYTKQYVFPPNSSLKAISVDNVEKTMYVLSGTKVLKVTL